MGRGRRHSDRRQHGQSRARAGPGIRERSRTRTRVAAADFKILDFEFWIEVSGRRTLIENLKLKIQNRMVPLYQQQLAVQRQAFPAPVSEPVHDGYVVFSLLRTLDRVNALHTHAPNLGTPCD